MPHTYLSYLTMERPATPPPPTRQMTRDQRIQARTLHSIGLSYQDIQKWFIAEKSIKLTYRQIYYACTTRATPQKRTGRPPVLTTNQIEEIIDFVSLSKTNRRMAYWRIAIELGWEGVGETAIRSALRRAGYKVYSYSLSHTTYILTIHSATLLCGSHRSLRRTGNYDLPLPQSI